MILGKTVNTTIQDVLSGQEDMMNRNKMLRVEQIEIESTLKNTIKQLNAEKELTIERQVQLRTLTASLKGSLG